MSMTVSRTHYRNNARPCDSWWRYLEDEMNVEMIGPQRVRHSIAGREFTKARDEAADVQGPLRKVLSDIRYQASCGSPEVKKETLALISIFAGHRYREAFLSHLLYIYM